MMVLWKASLRSLPGRAWHLVLCLAAVTIGTGVIVAALTLTAETRATADSVVDLLAADINVVPEQMLEAPEAVPVAPVVSEAAVAEIAELPNVVEARGAIFGGELLVLDSDGEVVQPQLAPMVSGSLPGPDVVSVTDGRAPDEADEVVVDAATLLRGGGAVGEPMTFLRTGPLPPITATVVGVVEPLTHPAADGSLVFFSDAGARQHFLPEAEGGFNWIRVTPADGVELNDLRLPLLSASPGNYHVVAKSTVAQSVWLDLHHHLAITFAVLLVGVLLALLIAGFVIGSAVSNLATAHRPGLARLRRMGVSEAGVRLPALVEALVLGVVGSLLALLAGRWVAVRLNEAAWDHGLALGGVVSPLPGWLALLAVILGTLITLVGTNLALSIPANRSPLEPQRQPPPPRLQFSDASWTSVGMVAVGIALLIVGTRVPGMPFPLAWVVLGGCVLLVGTAIATPVLGTPIIRAIGAALRPLIRDVATLAARNVERQPGRFGQAGAALVLVTGVLAALAVLGASGRASANHDIPNQLPGAVFILSEDQTTASPQITAAAAELPGVESIHSYGRAAAFDGTGSQEVLITDVESLGALTSLEVIEGRSPQEIDELLVEEEFARSAGIQRGDGLSWSVNLQATELRVVGIFSTNRNLELPDVVSLRDTFTSRGYPDNTSLVAMTTAPGVSAAELVSQARELVTSDPLLEVMTPDQLAAQRGDLLAASGETASAFINLLLVVSIIGISGVLLVALHERRDEIRALQLAGLGDVPIAGMIALEAVIMGTVAGLLGTIAGTLSGWALQNVLDGSGYSVLAIEWGTLLGLVGTGVLVGMAGAVVPAGNVLLHGSESVYDGPNTGERQQGAESADTAADPQT